VRPVDDIEPWSSADRARWEPLATRVARYLLLGPMGSSEVRRIGPVLRIRRARAEEALHWASMEGTVRDDLVDGRVRWVLTAHGIEWLRSRGVVTPPAPLPPEEPKPLRKRNHPPELEEKSPDSYVALPPEMRRA
jgi:hypothetical protein